MPKWKEIPAPREDSPRPHAASGIGNGKVASGDLPPVFTPRQPVRSMRDLIVPADVRSRLDLAIRRLEHHEVLYRDWNLKKIDPHRAGTALNFYGDPGTGKSLAAEAIAAQRGQPLIDVNYAEIESKYVGDTPKNIVACFEQAARHEAVLVFNEADSILGSRLSNVTQSADHSVNVSRAVMLSQLDAFSGLVVFTTNFPQNYDAAFVRRILVHVRFTLPDLQTRRRLWQALVPAELPREEPFDVAELAVRSEGLSGGDMVNVILAAAAEAVGRPEPLRRLRAADVLPEIEAALRAKAEVGKRPSGARVVSVDRLDRLPEEADPPPEPPAAPAAP